MVSVAVRDEDIGQALALDRAGDGLQVALAGGTGIDDRAVITWTGGRPDNLQAFLMSALFWAIHPLTGWLIAAVALLNPRWRCAHDFLAGTVVVRSDARPRLT